MRTKNLFGSVAIVALIGGAAIAQEAERIEMENDGRLSFMMEDGEQVMEGDEPVVLRADGSRAAPEEYRIDESGEIVILALASEVEGERDEQGRQVVRRQAVQAEGAQGQFIVQQAEPTVNVEVPDPTVTVDQATPQVTVEQPQPEITVRQSPPTVNVEQQAPVITVQQQQPVVTVRIPEPIVTIRMPSPDVQVAQGDPEVQVETPQPVVEFIRPEPQIRVEQAEAQVNVAQAEPQVDINRTTEADVEIQQAEAEVSIEEQGEAEVNVTEAEPQVNVEQAEDAEIQVEQAEAEIDVQQEEAEVEVVDQANVFEADPEAVAQLETDGYIVSSDMEETEELRTQRIAGYDAYAEMTVDDLVGTEVVAADGEEVGEIDNVALIGERLVAIVGVGGFLGIGEHDVALPLERLMMEGESMVADGLTAERFENFPAYDEASAEFVPADGRIGDLYQ